jgi:hypothetical protein
VILTDFWRFLRVSDRIFTCFFMFLHFPGVLLHVSKGWFWCFSCFLTFFETKFLKVKTHVFREITRAGFWILWTTILQKWQDHFWATCQTLQIFTFLTYFSERFFKTLKCTGTFEGSKISDFW